MPCQKLKSSKPGEGIEFSFLAYPTNIVRESGVNKLVCQQMRLGEKIQPEGQVLKQLMVPSLNWKRTM